MAQGILGLPPGMREWMLAEQHADTRNAAQLHQAAGILGLQDRMQQAALEQRLAPFKERLLAAQAADVEAKPADRAQAMKNQQEATLGRLAQQMAQYQQTWQLRYKAETTKEGRLALEREAQEFTQARQAEAQRLAGFQGQYNFGFEPRQIMPTTVGSSTPLGTVPTSTPAAPGILQRYSPEAPIAPATGGPLQERMRVPPALQAERDQTRLQYLESERAKLTDPQQIAVLDKEISNANSAVLGPLAQAAAPATPTAELPPFGGVQLGGTSTAGPGIPVAAPLPGAIIPGVGPTAGAIARPPAPAPAVATPVAPAKPIMPAFTGPPKERIAKENQWLLQQSKPSISGGGELTPQALEFVAKQYLEGGDRQAIQGFARSTTARIAIQNAIVDEAIKQGMSPAQVAAKIAEFAGTVAGSRTVGQRAANIALAATEAEEMIGIVKDSSDKFGRTNFVPWNAALRAYETGTGSPEIAAFGASVNALVNVYARAINPTGVPTVSDKEHARAVLNTVQSPQQVDAVLGIIGRELEIAKRAPATVRGAIKQGIVGEAQPKEPSIRASDQDLINKYLKK